MSEKLKPCPFCSGEAEIASGHGYPDEKIVRCTQCHATAREDYFAYTAMDLWNQRVNDALLSGVRKLVGAIQATPVAHQSHRPVKAALEEFLAQHPEAKP